MRQSLGQSKAPAGRPFDGQVRRDLLALAGFLVAGYVLASQLRVFSRLQDLILQHAELPLSDLFGTLFLAALGLALYGFTRSGKTSKELDRRVEAEEHAAAVAMHDHLTGLPNRRHLKAVLNWQLSRPRDQRQFALLIVNLDGFRAINEEHGRAAADELLMSVGQLLNLKAGVGGFVARVENDEFAIILHNVSEDGLMDWVSALLTAIEAPFRLTSHDISTGASVGIAMAPADGDEAEVLLHRATMAMRKAKLETRGWFAFFKAGTDDRVQERARFEHDLWLAVSNDEIDPWYQPVARLSDGKVQGFSVTPRWTHEQRGIVEPAQFLPVATGADLLEELTLNVLRRACRETADWWGAPYLSLNLPASMLEDEFLPVKVLKILEETGFAAGRLEIALAEDALEDFNAARSVMMSLKNQGVRITLDHYGAGDSTLGQLWALPFDKLKIDGAFVEAMLQRAEAKTMIRAIVGLAQTLDLSVAADCVETEEQAKALAALGCETGQGGLFGPARLGADAAPVREQKLMITVDPAAKAG